MHQKSLEDCVTGYPSDAKITPKIVAARFDKTLVDFMCSWVPKEILRLTRFGMLDYKMRRLISIPSARLAFENAVRSKVRGFGIECEAAPTAHLILECLADDPRLSEAVTPDFLEMSFSSELRQQQWRAATYYFQASENSKDHRAAIDGGAVSKLFQGLRECGQWELVAEVLKTTEHNFPQRLEILSPKTVRDIFSECVSYIEQGMLTASHGAKQILRHTFSQPAYRGSDGINPVDVERFKSHFRTLIKQNGSERQELGVYIEQWIEYVEVCTANVFDREEALRLREYFTALLSLPDNIVVTSHARDCLEAITAFPALSRE